MSNVHVSNQDIFEQVKANMAQDHVIGMIRDHQCSLKSLRYMKMQGYPVKQIRAQHKAIVNKVKEIVA